MCVCACVRMLSVCSCVSARKYVHVCLRAHALACNPTLPLTHTSVCCLIDQHALHPSIKQSSHTTLTTPPQLHAQLYDLNRPDALIKRT